MTEQMRAQEEEMRQNMEELQATQEEMQRSQAETDSTLSAIHSSLSVADYNIEGTLTKVNSNFLDLFGYTQDDVLGEHHRVFATKEDKTSESIVRSERLHRISKERGLKEANRGGPSPAYQALLR